MNSKQLVYATLENRNFGRVPRHYSYLPWASIHHQDMLDKLNEDFPQDMAGVGCVFKNPPKTEGEIYKRGVYVDEFGCKFVNIQDGIMGECKEPLVVEDDWSDWEKVHIPYEMLDWDEKPTNDYVQRHLSDKFIFSGFCPHPFEQLQFIRGTENLYMDLLDPPPLMLEFIKKLHAFYCDMQKKWAKTDVDMLLCMDDWGSQRALLVDPRLWRSIFKPLYKDYADIAHRAGKKIYMHSDGYTLDILPDLIEIGMDAVNLQIFCIGVEKLKAYKGKITFWGEIDRQNLLPYADTKTIENAVKLVYDTLYENGGCVAQCEFGAGANPDNVYTVYKTWSELKK